MMKEEMGMNRKWMALLMTGSLLTGAGGTYAAMTWKAAEEEVPCNTIKNDNRNCFKSTVREESLRKQIWIKWCKPFN